MRGRARKGVSAGSSEHFALPRSFPALRDVDVLLGWFGGASDAVRAVSLGTSLVTRVPWVRGVLGEVIGRVVTGSSGGPDADARAGTGSYVVAEAMDAGGRVLATVALEGVNGYDFTAAMLAWASHAMAAGRAHGQGRQSDGEAGPAAEGALGGERAAVGQDDAARRDRVPLAQPERQREQEQQQHDRRGSRPEQDVLPHFVELPGEVAHRAARCDQHDAFRLRAWRVLAWRVGAWAPPDLTR